MFFYLEDRERTLDSAMEKGMLSLTNFAAEMEREKASQRTHDALIRKAKAGHVASGKVYGYDNVELVRRDWRFSLTLIATLATGIAASGAIFNVVNASLLRPLPIPDEERVFRLQDYTPNPGGQRVLRSNRVLNFLAIHDEAERSRR